MCFNLFFFKSIRKLLIFVVFSVLCTFCTLYGIINCVLLSLSIHNFLAWNIELSRHIISLILKGQSHGYFEHFKVNSALESLIAPLLIPKILLLNYKKDIT